MAGVSVRGLGGWRFLRRHRRAVAMGLGLVTVSFGGASSWKEGRDFQHPEKRRARDDIARPIPGQEIDCLPRGRPEADRWSREPSGAAARPDRKSYVLLRAGAWGHSQAVLTYKPAIATVNIRQNLERRRGKNLPAAAPTRTPHPSR